jgi:putative transport protein
MSNMREILLKSEPLLLFFVIGLGYVIGKIRIKGLSLGISAVLFVGILLGGWRPEGSASLIICPQISEVGLILFVYIVGVTSGAGFFNSFKKRGVRLNVAVLIALVTGAVFTFFLGLSMHLSFGQIAGVYCGGLTNTPALAAVTEIMKGSGDSNPSDAAVGYSVAYPYGVICGILAFHLFFRIFKRRDEKESVRETPSPASEPVVRNFRISNRELFGRTIGELQVRDKTGILISRLRHGGEVIIPNKYTVLHEGDVIVALGSPEDMAHGAEYFGEESTERLEDSRREIDIRRILVSRRQLVGKTIGELGLHRKFNAQITRLRRADVEIVASPDMTLEMGDRLMVVLPVEKTAEVTQFFGDSVRVLAELDFTAFMIGISLGVLIGMVPIPLPGGNSLSLGFAGGPLIMGLILGRLSRTGPFVWSIPLEMSKALSHLGILFFLAGVGIKAGGAFFDAMSSAGWRIFLLGFGTTTLTTLLTLVLIRWYARGSLVQSLGATSGMQTQPATLACAYELTKSEDTYVAYATTYPLAMIGKILLAQLIFIIGQNLFLP